MPEHTGEGEIMSEQRDKEKRFYMNPENFIEIKDLIVATMNSPKGIKTLINAVPREQLEISQSRLNHLIEQKITGMEIIALKKQQGEKRIVTPSIVRK